MAKNKTEPNDSPCNYGGVGLDDIFSMSRDLGQRISESGIYKDYNMALLKVKSSPELMAGIAEFKRVQIDYSRGEISFDQEKHLSKMHFSLYSNSDAARFLEIEKKMLALILEVHENLWADCDVLIIGDEAPI